MKQSLQKLKKSVGALAVITLVICILFGIFTLFSVRGIVTLARTDLSAFRIALMDTGVNQSQEYHLYINDKECSPVDYNRYALHDFSGNTNYKQITVIHAATELISRIIVEIILILLYQLFVIAKKGMSPFIRKSAIILQIIGALCIALAVLPPLIGIAGSFLTFGYYSGYVSTMNVYVIIIGVAFAFIADIFQFGIALQQDSDSIA